MIGGGWGELAPPPAAASMHLPSLRALAAFPLLLSVAGCGAAAEGGRDSSALPAVAERGVTVDSDSLRLRLELPADVRAGAIVPIVLRLENVGERTLELYLRGRTIAFDVIVAPDGGAVVWRRLEDEIIPAIVQLRVLAPGEVVELRAEWDQRTSEGRPAGAGAYVVRGQILTEGPAPLESPPATLRIREK